MPYYDFHCDNCKRDFTRQYMIKDMPQVGHKVKCEYCKQRAVRVFRASNVSGWSFDQDTATGPQCVEHFDQKQLV